MFDLFDLFVNKKQFRLYYTMKMVCAPLTFPSPNYVYNLLFITNWLSPMVTLEKVMVHTKQIISNIITYYQT